MSQVNFIDYRLDDRVSYGFRGGPDWNTTRTPMKSTGIVRRNRKWLLPQHRFVAAFALPKDEAFDELRAMTYVACGGWLAFRFKDWDDFECVHQYFGAGDGTSEPMQLVKTYTKGPRTFVRVIRLPLGAVVVDEDDAPVAVTVDPLTGMATPSSPWPTGKSLYWSGEFDVPVYFESDFNPMTRRSPGVSTQQVALVEELAPLIAIEPED